jgi:FSR family fosmidomycin resistance protein-like MFS transporter
MKRKKVLGIISFFHFIQDGYIYSIFILLPFITKEFDLRLSEAGFLKTALSGTASLFQIPAVFIAEKIGEAAGLIGGFGLLSIGYVIMAGSASFFFLFLLTLFAGLGHSVQHPIGTSMVSEAYETEGLGTSVGTLNLSGDIGKVCVSLLVTFIVAAYGWRASLIVLGILGITVTAAAGLLRKHLFPIKEKIPASEKRLPGRYRRFSGIKNRAFVVLSIIGLIDCSTRMTVFTFIPFLALQQGMTKDHVGFVVNLLFFGGIFGKFVCGYLTDRFDGGKVIMLSEFVTALLMMALLYGSVYALIPLALILGITLNGSSSVLYSIVPSLFPQETRTMGYAFFYTFYLFAGAIGPAFYGLFGDIWGVQAIFVFLTIATLTILPLTVLFMNFKKSLAKAMNGSSPC